MVSGRLCNILLFILCILFPKTLLEFSNIWETPFNTVERRPTTSLTPGVRSQLQNDSHDGLPPQKADPLSIAFPTHRMRQNDEYTGY